MQEKLVILVLGVFLIIWNPSAVEAERTVSANGYKFIQRWEGCYLEAYP